MPGNQVIRFGQVRITPSTTNCKATDDMPPTIQMAKDTRSRNLTVPDLGTHPTGTLHQLPLNTAQTTVTT